MDNKNIFAENLKRQMEIKGVSRNDICRALGISYFTVSDWVNGKKYPRRDKVELLANYFGILKSDLIEEKSNDDAILPADPPITEGEQLLLDLFRKIPEDQQQLVLQMIRAALSAQEQ